MFKHTASSTIKTLFVFAIIVTLFQSRAFALSGSGTQGDPYVITSLSDFDEFAGDSSYWDDYIRLEVDIDLAGRTYTTAVIAPDMDNSDYSGFTGTKFSGVFDGNGHVINNLTVDAGNANHDFLALFGLIDTSGHVFGLNLNNITIASNSHWDGTEQSLAVYIGGLCGENSGMINNCSVTGVISANYCTWVGGLAGQNLDGKIRDSESCINITVGDYSGYVGGIAGVNLSAESIASIVGCKASGFVEGGTDTNWLGGMVGINMVVEEGGISTISSCSSTVNITGGDDSDYLGGLVGSNYGYGTGIGYCYASGDIIAGSNSKFLGGLSGVNAYEGIIFDSYAIGDVHGYQLVGGFCGANITGVALWNCYSTGDVNGSVNVGGFCGRQQGTGSEMRNCFWDIDTSGMTTGYVLSTSIPGVVENVEGKTTSQMYDSNTFINSGWDFVGEAANGDDDWWRSPYQQGYPILHWQRDIPGDFTGGYGVNLIDYSIFAASWMSHDGDIQFNADCNLANYGDSTDVVNISDLMIFCEHWLEGIFIDILSPLPDPATFSSPPTAIGVSVITMSATIGIDESGIVEYYFDEMSGNPGGTDSGWQQSETYTDTGLDPNTLYAYTVQMRDSAGNYGTISESASATTLIETDVPDDMIVYMSFDDGTADDNSGNGNDGTVYQALPVSGVSGQALSFDGIDDQVEIGGGLNDLTGQVTVSLWVKANTASVDKDYVFNRIADGGGRQRFGLRQIGTKLYAQTSQSDDFEISVPSTSDVDTSSFQHIVYKRDAVSLSLYVNGILEGSAPWDGTDKTIPYAWTIGRRGDGFDELAFAGEVDEVKIFDRALTDSEILSLYQEHDNSLVAYWSFDDLSDLGHDDSGNGNDGILEGGVSAVPGRVGQALTFDGIDDYVRLDDVITDYGTATFSVWFKTTQSGTGNHGNILNNNKGGKNDDVTLGAWDYSGTQKLLFSRQDLDTDENYDIPSDSAINDGQWHHAVGVLSSSGMMLYIDGVLQLITHAFSEPSTNQGNWAIGASAYDYGTMYHYFNGQIDEVRIYNRALSDIEILSLYQNP